MAIDRIRVRARSGSYEVLCGSDVLKRAPRELARFGKPARRGGHTGVFLLSSRRVWHHWGKKCEAVFRRAGAKQAILFDDREAAKNLATVEKVCRQLVRAGADRRALLLAIGGGVVGDVAGFVAASYLRGVSLVHVPTTLVAQVDSAIGGKTGVNLPEGKNLVGAFYPPRLVLADPWLLSTLPDREFRSGLYEVIKYGVIGDRGLLHYLEEHLDALLRREPKVLPWTITRCIRAKARVVSRDERESGLREILNFGHTFAHALEAVTHYRRFLHGEAVAYGMIAAAALSEELGCMRTQDVARIVRLVLRVGPLPPLPEISTTKLVAAMRADKKSRGGKLRFVLVRRIGRVTVGNEVDDADVARAWSRVRQDRLLSWHSRSAIPR